MSDESPKSGKIGNLNAKKSKTKNCHLHIRIEEDKKKQYEESAKKEGLSTAQWIIRLLDEKSK